MLITFTSGQAMLLKRYTTNVLLAYDSDEAGTKAALRALGILREAGLSGKVINMQPYKDPDEFIKNLGVEEFEKRIEKAENGFLFENGNSKDFADKVLTLAENKLMQLKFGENLFNKATNEFSNDNLAKSHIKIYERILKDFYDNKKYDIVLSGYYGFNNSGDDALLTAIINNLRVYKEDVRILTLSKNPKQTKKLFKVDAINRFNPFIIYKSLLK